MNSAALFFEDIEPGDRIVGDSHLVDKAHMLAFAREWNPLPIHVDEAAGREAFGSLTAPGLYILAIKQLLLLPSPISVESIIVSFGYDELRFHKPVRPGDTVTLGIECVDKRASRSRPEAGIITFRLSLTNQLDELALSHLDTVLIRRRAAE
jgi:acyl dehydratase